MNKSSSLRNVHPVVKLQVITPEYKLTDHSQRIIPKQTDRQRMPTTIAIATSDCIEILKIADITHCSADSNYCEIHFRNGRSILVSKTLKIIEAAIASMIFFRVHQSYLVNLSDIQKITTNEIHLWGGLRIPVSRRKRSILMQKIQETAVLV